MSNVSCCCPCFHLITQHHKVPLNVFIHLYIIFICFGPPEAAVNRVVKDRGEREGDREGRGQRGSEGKDRQGEREREEEDKEGEGEKGEERAREKEEDGERLALAST